MSAILRPSSATDLLPDKQAAERWVRSIWGERRGWAQTATGRGGHYPDPLGKYSFSEFTGKAYRWPDDGSALLDALLTAAPDADVFVCPLLRNAASRKRARSHALAGRHAWIDADTWDDEHQSSLQAVGLPLLQVSSGGAPGNQHIYIDLGAVVPGAEVAEWSRRLEVTFDTDTYGGDNKLLRLPGTFNHKGRARGGPSGLVRWLP